MTFPALNSLPTGRKTKTTPKPKTRKRRKELKRRHKNAAKHAIYKQTVSDKKKEVDDVFRRERHKAHMEACARKKQK